MHDSEDYHTGRAAAYYRVAGLLRAGCKPAELRDICERAMLDAEATANERSAPQGGPHEVAE